MPAKPIVHPKQVKAARAMLGWSHFDLAKRAKIGRATVQRCEFGMAIAPKSVDAIKAALERAGVKFIAVKGGLGLHLQKRKR
jgi:ribosome-binding protein aMBF1 (putative translation factor)